MTGQFEEFSSPAFSAPLPTPPSGSQDGGVTERYRYLLANTPAIIYSSVPSGDFKLTFVSENAWRVLGYQPAEMLEDPNFWFYHIHPDDVPLIFSSLAQLFVEGQRTYEYRFRAADGRYLWMHDTLRLIRDENGQPVEVIGSMTDITERKRMEDALQKKGEEQQLLIQQLHEAQAQLLQSEKMASLGQLAAGMAHEINNPISFVSANMNSLRNYVKTLLSVIERYEATWEETFNVTDIAGQLKNIRRQADVDFVKDDVSELLAESQDGLKRVKEIVQSLKDFSRVGESGWQIVDLHKGLDSTLEIMAGAFAKITIEKRYGKLPLIKCAAFDLNQVFLSLLTNAAHAIEDSGAIVIETQHRGDWVALSIRDTGCGIAPDHLEHIFEPFFTTRPVGSGTGLGLSLSYGIVQKHHGRIEVISTPGSGSTFTVWLPLDPEHSATSPERTSHE
ncbi:PAS domain S-box protein [Oxalobacteraceae bacterium CAVE-383]|nr:PAS domain S-box protein [Oxalobacteraceae bacterium CAVE-383]